MDVPQFWGSRLRQSSKRLLSSRSSNTKSRQHCNMYFDDCERRPLIDDWEGYLPELNSRVAWTTSRAEAKENAIQQLLGYNAKSASLLSTDQVEMETLQWAADCNIVWVPEDGEENEDNQQARDSSRYSSISDLIVASECESNISCLALLWKLIANLLENHELNSLYMIVFPSATSLWDYDNMVTTLQALAISRPLLPASMQNVQLDLFHPDYKHSPRMWSPEMHSPFPTLGLSIQSQVASVILGPNRRNSNFGGSDSMDDVDAELETARSRLENLFASIDADDQFRIRSREENLDPRKILKECMDWGTRRGISVENTFVVDTHVEPFHIYACMWSVIQELQAAANNQTDRVNVSSLTRILVTPNLDAYTMKRLAITVNVALQRLHCSVRVSDIFYPTTSRHDPRGAPHAMIQLTLDYAGPPQ